MAKYHCHRQESLSFSCVLNLKVIVIFHIQSAEVVGSQPMSHAISVYLYINQPELGAIFVSHLFSSLFVTPTTTGD